MRGSPGPKGTKDDVTRDLSTQVALPSWATAVPTPTAAAPVLLQLTSGGLAWDLSLPLAQAAFLGVAITVTLTVGSLAAQTAVLDRTAAVRLGMCA